jgi:Phosphate transporter family
MSDSAASPNLTPSKELDAGSSRIFLGLFGIILFIGVVYTGVHLGEDLSGVRSPSALAYVLLGIALAIALGFEFVNGFHDTANAVATVIYTNALPANFAVIWSGIFNFLGVLASTGGVAFTIVSLLPVELILQVGSGNAVHSQLGEGRRGAGAGHGHDGGLEADRAYRGRENRQAAPHLCARPLRRGGDHGVDPGRYGLPSADEHHPCAHLRCRRYHGGERLRPAMGDNSQPGRSLGVHAAGVDFDLRCIVCSVSGDILEPDRLRLTCLCTLISGGNQF